eukprot:TRINITY_DN40759_c0_g1_i1.p1 TRINITY_DN40759_c0_g1~~TRINITY_DN40759_c0_g1_i1.p1  ORF type:complete len:810 (-),score=162.98 TRINITY_DN40759_c0_g1_i1:69-2498(-)
MQIAACNSANLGVFQAALVILVLRISGTAAKNVSDCRCIFAGNALPDDVINNYPEDEPGKYQNLTGTALYGTFCAAWEQVPGTPYFDSWCPVGQRPEQKGERQYNWCYVPWCYVDESCPTAQSTSTFKGAKAAFYSYEACGGTDCFTNSAAGGRAWNPGCPWDPYGDQKYEVYKNDCKCIYAGKGIPDNILSNYPEGDRGKYKDTKAISVHGSTCAQWDLSVFRPWSDECTQGLDFCSSLNNWCQVPWCWVGQECATGIASALFQGASFFFSYDTCQNGPNCFNIALGDGAYGSAHIGQPNVFETQLDERCPYVGGEGEAKWGVMDDCPAGFTKPTPMPTAVPTQEPTAAPTPMRLSFVLVLENVDYDTLMGFTTITTTGQATQTTTTTNTDTTLGLQASADEIEKLKDDLLRLIQVKVAAEAGDGMKPQHVFVSFSPGSVRATITLYPPLEGKEETIQEKLSSSEVLAGDLLASIKALPNIQAVATGELGVMFSADVWVGDIPTTTTTTTTSAFSEHWINDEMANYLQSASITSRLTGSMSMRIITPDPLNDGGAIAIANGTFFRFCMAGAIASGGLCHEQAQGMWPNCTTTAEEDADFVFEGWNASENVFPVVVTGVMTGEDASGDDDLSVPMADGTSNINVNFLVVFEEEQPAVSARIKLQSLASISHTIRFGAQFPGCHHCYLRNEEGVKTVRTPGECRPKFASIASGEVWCVNDAEPQQYWCSPEAGVWRSEPCVARASSRMADYVERALADQGRSALKVDIMRMQVVYDEPWNLGGADGHSTRRLLWLLLPLVGGVIAVRGNL